MLIANVLSALTVTGRLIVLVVENACPVIAICEISTGIAL